MQGVNYASAGAGIIFSSGSELVKNYTLQCVLSTKTQHHPSSHP